MKKIFFPVFRITCSALLLLLFSGCLKDKITRTYKINTPIYQSLTQARTMIKSGQATAIQNPGKITVYRNYLFLNEVYKGVHVIDNSDPAHPKNIAFINIPGNMDISVKDNILYADESYGDLVTLDISDPANVITKKFIPNLFTTYYYYSGYYSGSGTNPDSIQIITGWITKDTTVNYDPDHNPIYANPGCPMCEYAMTANSNLTIPTKTGTNGSTARFAIENNYLYTLSSAYGMNVIDISNAGEPVLLKQIIMGWNAETIFPFENKLFIGSTSGMFVYDITDPASPVKQSAFAHVQSCDPVIADGNHAFVTLRSGTACQGFTNELDVLDISYLNNPTLIKSYPLTNPRGLSKDGDLLFICDGKDGLKIYNAALVTNLKLIKTIGGMEANEVIAMNGKAIVIATDGLYQFDYSDINNIHQLSKIESHATAL